jgi:hypothetical protein
VSLALDPGSASAHRFISDAKSGEARHEITRASELLQAELRQPISVTPLPARLSNDRLFSSRADGPNAAGFDEFGSLFLADGVGFQAHGVAGNHGTRGEQALVSLVSGPLGLGASALDYHTDGIRPNSDYQERGASAIVQAAISPRLSIQTEVQTRRREFGDIVSRFFADSAGASDRNTDRLGDVRVGARYVIDPSSDVLVSVAHRDDRTDVDFGGGLTIGTRNQTTKGELQHLVRGERWSLVSGISYLRGSSSEDVFGDVTDAKPSHLTIYSYWTDALVANRLYVIGGASYDHLQTREAGDQKQLNPKLGVLWRPAGETTVRATVFRALKRKVNADSTLEPTQIAGFDQFYDDVNGTESHGVAVSADGRPLRALRVGVAASRRTTNSPFTNSDGSIGFNGGKEQEAGVYAHWTFGQSAVLSTRARYSRWDRPAATTEEGFAVAETVELPITLKTFGPAGLWTSLVVTPVRQRGRFRQGPVDIVPGSSRFVVADLAVGYRFAQRRGNASFECANLFNRAFQYQDIGLEGARYAPQRTCLVRLSVEV